MPQRRPGRGGRRAAGVAALLACGAYGALQWGGRTYGATRAERRATMPGDGLVPHAKLSITHATTVPTGPERVWPWLVQVGWGRGGWYTPRWVDALLFPANLPSATRVLPQHQHLRVGDSIPDGPPETQCSFTVVDLVPERRLVLRSTSHLPLTWRERGLAGVDWSWAFTLRPNDGGTSTRLVFRWRAWTAPGWLTAAAQALVVPADLVMSRGMLHGIRARATASTTADGGGSR